MASRSVPLGTRVRDFLEGSPAGGELRGVTAWWRQEAGVIAGRGVARNRE